MKLKTIATLSALGSLMGCNTLTSDGGHRSAVVVNQGGIPALVSAAPLLKPSMSMSESLYAMARLAHSEGQLAMAAQRYEKLLATKPDHVGALNALGVIRAQDGRTAEALELFVRARDLAPSVAHIYNNMGYALLRDERLDEAQVALRMALELAPESSQTLKNLNLLAKARAEGAGVEEVTPSALPKHHVVEGIPAPAIVAVAPSVFELRLSTRLSLGPLAPTPETVGAQPSTPAAQEFAALAPADNQEPGYKLVLSRDLALQAGPFAIWTDIRGVKLEVSNGVGIERLAKRTAVRLAEAGVATSRLTNARPYNQERTQIQYLPGQQAAVKALAARLPVPVELVQVGQLGSSVQLRLVLGHDVAGRAIASWIDNTAPTHLAHTAVNHGASS